LVRLAHWRPQVGPTMLERRQGNSVETLGLGGVSRLEGELLFALPQLSSKIVRHTLAEPINAGLGCFQGRAIARAICVPPLCATTAARTLLVSGSYGLC
jgi:hypothetical protein